MNDEHLPKISKEETLETKTKSIFIRFWQDSVFSQLIANAILISLPLVTAVIIGLFTSESFSDFFTNFFLFQIKLYILISVIVVLIFFYFLYLKYIERARKTDKYFAFQTVGDYRFGDLNNILLTTYCDLPPPLNHQIGLKDLDLLTLFKLFVPQLSFGIGWDHPTPEGQFLHYNLGPKLLGYGLCEKIPSIDNNTEGNINSYTIQLSATVIDFSHYLKVTIL